MGMHITNPFMQRQTYVIVIATPLRDRYLSLSLQLLRIILCITIASTHVYIRIYIAALQSGWVVRIIRVIWVTFLRVKVGFTWTCLYA